MECYQICLIIIRMAPAAPQNEAKMFRCSECNGLIFRYDQDMHVGPPHRFYPELPNIRVYADAVEQFNATDRENRERGVKPQAAQGNDSALAKRAPSRNIR